MKILIYGSTYLTEVCVTALQDDGHNVIGYVHNVNAPTVPGEIDLPALGGHEACDFVLSIQYDRRILIHAPAYNLHTGLLPEWGGCDILYHTLREGAFEQGLTFHRLANEFDCGPVLTRITYPVLPGDTMVDLYRRAISLAPGFVCQAVRLLEEVGIERSIYCHAEPPRMFRRGQIDGRDVEIYRQTPALLRAIRNEAK